MGLTWIISTSNEDCLSREIIHNKNETMEAAICYARHEGPGVLCLCDIDHCPKRIKNKN